MRGGLLLVFSLACAVAFGATPAQLEDTLELPGAAPTAGAAFAIFITGDGGWAALDREVSARLAKADLPVVGWNARAYYWTRRTPEEAAADLGRIIRRFRTEWKRARVVVIGYSRGADVLPFLVTRLAPEDRAALQLVALLGPAHTIDFEFHLTDFVAEPKIKTALPVPAEIAKLRGLPVLVVAGEKDVESSVGQIPPDLGRIERVPGDHHFDRDYDRLAGLILDAARGAPAPTAR